jgi:D-tagatose-1,6-bisphosphate aldolase subunit GatZ/KbaZ
MNPWQFRDNIISIAEKTGFRKDRLILGGDHLGPHPFQDEEANTAMEKARVMIRDFVTAGFTKIHLDASMPLGGDSGKEKGILDLRLAAERCADLCSIAETTYERKKKEDPGAEPPFYVIGTEVPVPGGSDEVEEGIKVTSVSDLKDTVTFTKEAFYNKGLQDAWERVVAVVVQPGVEFGDHRVIEYEREKAAELCRAINEYDSLVFEAHSTDYQTAEKLREMVEDGCGILKVGPALTFALREGIFMLCHIEEELFLRDGDFVLSNFLTVVDGKMRKQPEHWEHYHTGTNGKMAFSRKYSLFDRIRYYLPNDEVKDAFGKLLMNVRIKGIPLTLLSQFFPQQYQKIRNGKLENDPEELLIDKIREVLNDYSYAVGNRL